MEPRYMNEIRYSYHVGSYRAPTTGDYEAASPESSFELTLQTLFLEGQANLRRQEYTLALQAFRELLALILRTVNPQMPVDPNRLDFLAFPVDLSLVDILAARTAATLQAVPVVSYTFPSTVVSQQGQLSAAVGQSLAALDGSGLQITSFHSAVEQQVTGALAEAAKQNWALAVKGYEGALASVPASQPLVQGALLHDLAVLSEKAGDNASAEQFGTQSVTLLGASQQVDLQVQALDTVTGILQRAGKADVAAKLAEQATAIRSTNNVNPVIVLPADVTESPASGFASAVRTGVLGNIALATVSRPILATPVFSAPAIGSDSPVARDLSGGNIGTIGGGFAGGTVAPVGPLGPEGPLGRGGVGPIGGGAAGGGVAPVGGGVAPGGVGPAGGGNGGHGGGNGGPVMVNTVSASVEAPALIGLRVLSEPTVVSAMTKTFTMQGASETASIVLDANAGANASGFLKTISATADIGLLTRYLFDRIEMVAYLPHLYFFVIPMSIGDCYAGMGNLDQAASQYASVLAYPFINQNLEIVRLWTRMAQVFLDAGDSAYRNAKDDPALYPSAQAFYENIVLPDRTVPAASPLYADAKLAGMRTRVGNFLAAPDPLAFDENPAVASIVLQAMSRLQQIQQGLNFFGFGPDYVAPFSFEYLQNTSRYFAQQASQIEQRFIQFKSQAENEQFRRDQLAQQADVARQSVLLEERGVAEAQRGVDVASASRDYSQTQLNNANQSKQDFSDNRWELLELDEAQAWASASAVDRNDEVKLSWSGNYYNSSSKPRNQVLQDLADQRGRLSQDLEGKRLDREVAAAQAYEAVAQAQIGEAQARVSVAHQRVVIAQLQQRQAEQNRDFLDMRQFGAQLWYDLAQQAERLKRRYLDMATEVAFLMERAYNAETERGLHVIRYDYQHTASGNLMGADMLAADIDYFTFDHITTTKTKKLPVKTTISLADAYPIQFQTLKSKGRCNFETALEDFDRGFPGLYLAKIHNVELVFVGITQATSISGTLRNVGVSRFRSSTGETVARLYPIDVMALSQYDIRQDALAFRFNPNELRLFENSGIATSWQLELPPSANDFNYADILDVHLVVYYDGFYDSALETKIRAALPTAGSASRAFSMRMSFPDELFYLKNQGQAVLAFDSLMFPQNQVAPLRTSTTLKVTGTPAVIQGLTLQLTAASLGASTLALKTDAAGEVSDAAAASALQALRGKTMFDTLTVKITAGDNPQLVTGGVLDLSGIEDVLVFSEYGFTFR